MPKKAVKRIIKKAVVSHLSFCPKGCNELDVLYKSLEKCTEKDNEIEFQTTTKEIEEGLIAAIVYLADHPDAVGDMAPKDVLKETAHEFSRNGMRLDMRHDFKDVAKDAAFVAESFIVQKGDPRFEGMKDRNGEPVNTEGAWATVIKIEDENLKAKYRSGEWKGISMGGKAIFEEVAKEDSEEGFLKKITDLFEKVLNKQNQHKNSEDIDMDKAELEKALKENAEVVATATAKAVAESIGGILKELLPKEKEKTDLTKEEEIAELNKQIEKLQKESESSAKELKAAKDRLAEISKASNAGEQDAKDKDLKKTDEEALKKAFVGIMKKK